MTRFSAACLTRWLVLLTWLGWLAAPAAAQPASGLRTPESFGYRHLTVRFGRDSVDVLVLSAPGQAQVRKPLLLWAQGSLPAPVILYDNRGAYPVFPFRPQAVLQNCHLVIIGKPGIALVANVEGQNPNQLFGRTAPPPYYCARNYLQYYVARDAAVLRWLKKQSWVDKTQVLVGGHSEGSNVAAHLAAVPGLVSRAIYLSGSPLGRALTEAARDPAEADTAAARDAESGFAKWQRAVDHPTQTDCAAGDSNQNTYSHGQSELPALLGARVPLFIGYGTRDAAAVANDYLRLEAIRLHKTNLTFRAYVGREHNFFGFKDGRINYDDFYWEQVGNDFLHWAGLLPAGKTN
ncbi:MAG: alpha/beta hydrolase family protein [Janthinobacterium lividum]